MRKEIRYTKNLYQKYNNSLNNTGTLKDKDSSGSSAD